VANQCGIAGGTSLSVVTPDARPDADSGFAPLLREWRQKRRLSQLDLALTSGVPQRHVSFLESGRANPSRNMILQLNETLDVPLRERNAWLTPPGSRRCSAPARWTIRRNRSRQRS